MQHILISLSMHNWANEYRIRKLDFILVNQSFLVSLFFRQKLKVLVYIRSSIMMEILRGKIVWLFCIKVSNYLVIKFPKFTVKNDYHTANNLSHLKRLHILESSVAAKWNECNSEEFVSSTQKIKDDLFFCIIYCTFPYFFISFLIFIFCLQSLMTWEKWFNFLKFLS